MQFKKNYRSFAILIGTLFFVISCGDRPSHVLSEDKMVDLLVDMELTEAYVNTQHSVLPKEKNEIGEQVLELHGVSKETLDTTLAWYGRNMDQYTALFEKVDKKINGRKKQYLTEPGIAIQDANNFWPYSTHLLISPLSGFNGLNFVVKNSEIEKGGVVVFSMYLPNVDNMKGSLIVEYEDGKGDAISQNYNSRHKIELQIPTDTSRIVSKIFGSFNLKDSKNLPLYIDSISLKTEPFDSVTYRNKRRNLKTFSPIS